MTFSRNSHNPINNDLYSILEESSAIKIQTAFRAYQARNELRELQYEKFQNDFLNNIPYIEFRDLICSEAYLNRTDLLGSFLRMTTKQEVRLPKKLIDPNFHKQFDQKYIQTFQQVCFDAFENRATEQITKNIMPWSQAVAMPAPKYDDPNSPKALYGPKPGAPIFPIMSRCNCCNQPDNYLILGYIFENVVAETDITSKAMSILNQKSIEQKAAGWGIITVFGVELAIELKPGHDEASLVKEKMDEDILSVCLQIYFKSLGKLSTTKTSLTMSDCDINWESSAQQVYQLGRLLFENKIDALTKLGGQSWLEKQPQDIQEIINAHVRSILQPQSWLKRLKNNIKKYIAYA